jgi:hypothetical protein
VRTTRCRRMVWVDGVDMFGLSVKGRECGV